MDERTSTLLRSYLPMSEQSFLLLLSLVEPRHGYAIMQTVSEQSGGRVMLGASTVYTILYKMEQDGLISVVSELDRRKVYAITPIGESILQAEVQRLAQLASFAKTVLSKTALQTSCAATK